MKNKTKASFQELADITNQKCQTCVVEPSMKFRCCHKIFCDDVKAHLPDDFKPTEPNIGGLPFMGPEGCVIPPHLRPVCTGYVCPGHLKDSKFLSAYTRLAAKIEKDPSAPRMLKNLAALRKM